MDLDKANRWLTLVANIGVLIGLIVLIVELRQNSDIMRAQMHNEAAAIRVSNRHAEANSGEIARIQAKLAEAAGRSILDVDESPLEILTEEEKIRLRSRYIGIIDDLSNLYFQCQEGFLDPEFCEHRFRTQVAALLPQWHALGIRFFAQRPSFLAEVQRIALEEGLPSPNNDGTWAN